MSDVTYQVCGAKYDTKTEQHASIELFGQCIPCKFTPNGFGSNDGTQKDIEAIQEKVKELR